ncbi:hypothetical protein HK104_007745 [Borealophlyctis nickersoniae]|nr:hypothetical protein HK104_007745 [Borealophlyctis nickersoniae]
MTAAVSNVGAAHLPEKAKWDLWVDSFEVGWLFVQEYYTFLNRDPHKLHCFFNKKSCFSHGYEGETTKQCYGQQEIHKRIVELDFQDCKVLVSNVDSQASLNGGIIVQVLGEMSNKGQASHKFAQTFFLAEQPNGYYVLNDIFRFLKEDIDDNEYEDPEDTADAIVPEQFVTEHPPTYHHQEQVLTSVEPEPAKIEKARSPSPAKEQAPVVANTQPTAAHVQEDHEPAAWREADASTNEHANWESHTTEQSAPAETKPWTAVSKPKAAESNEQKVSSSAQTVAAAPQTSSTGAQTSKQASAAPAPAPSTPSQPKTWASLAAKNATAWRADASPAKGQVAPTAASPAKANRPLSPPEGKASAPKVAPKKQEEDVEPDVNSEQQDSEQGKDGGFREVQNRRFDQKRPQQQQHDDEREKYSIYIRGITEGIDKQSLHATFKAVGAIRHVDLIPSKNIAFVEFTTIEAAQKAIGQTFNINGHTVTAEERKKRTTFVRNGAGGQYPPRRDFQDGGNRGRGGDGYYNRGNQSTRGRGGAGPRPEGAGAGAGTGKPQGKAQNGKQQ